MKRGMNGSKKFNHVLELRKELWEKVKKRRDEGRIAYLLTELLFSGFKLVLFEQKNGVSWIEKICKMTPGINFESLSYSTFSIHENSISREHDSDINFYQDIFFLETHYTLCVFQKHG